MIVFGSRMYGRRDKVRGWGRCDHCGVYGRHLSYNGRKWGHLYFIPLIPAGPRVRVLKQCAKCQHGIHVPETEVPAMLSDMRRSVALALSALVAGRTEFKEEGSLEPVPCAAFLAATVELLCCLGGGEDVEQLIATLRDENLTYAHHLVSGSFLELQADLDGAAAAYMQAAETAPQDPVPLTLLGDLCVGRKKPDDAQLLYEKALELDPNNLSIMQSLIEIYTAGKEHGKLAETYETCFKLMPDLAEDKKTLKAYKKACKKSGRSPVGTQ